MLAVVVVFQIQMAMVLLEVLAEVVRPENLELVQQELQILVAVAVVLMYLMLLVLVVQVLSLFAT
jgi:hypothetical protein